jgi:hypothetical protein
MTMSEYTVTMSFSGVRSRILVTAGTDEILRAVLPSPRQVRHTQAALSFLEALALWLDHSPRVVVSAAEVDATSLFGLTDDFGTPQRGVYYHVEVVEPRPRRRGKKLAGVGEFRDLRQLSLVPGGHP